MGGPMMASGHQSEAELENHLIRKLQSIGYHYVEIPDVETLNTHFRAVLSDRNQERLKGTHWVTVNFRPY